MTTVIDQPQTQDTTLPPKRPGGHWLMGDLYDFQADQLGFLLEASELDAPVVRLRFGPQTSNVLNTPEAVKHVLQTNNKNYIKDQRFVKIIEDGGTATLFTTDKDDWLWRRRLMQPMFHRKVIANFGTLMDEEIEKMLGRWATQPRPFDVEDEMMNLTLQIITRSMFSVDVQTHAPGLHHAYNVTGPYMIQRLMQIFPTPLWVPTAGNRQFNAALEEIKTTIQAIIDERRTTGELKHDLLDMLLAAHDDETGKSFTDFQLMIEMSGIMFAGHETTASLLTWVFYMLSQHPEVEARLHAELDDVLNGRMPTMDDLPHLPYTEMIIQETLRLYPPAHATTRQVVEDDVIEGYKVSAGDGIVVNIYGLHHNPAYWPEPERFNPERFSAEGVKQQTKLAYLPFLTGPRRCIGEQLAMSEAQMVIAAVAQKYHLMLADKHPVKETKFALRTADGLYMTLEPR